MQLFQLQKASMIGLYSFVSYPIKVTTKTTGPYVPGEGLTAGSCTTQTLMGFVGSFKRRELERTGVPFTAAKITLLRCEEDLDCVTCFEPTCGPYEGYNFNVWRGESGPFICKDMTNSLVELAVVESCA